MSLVSTPPPPSFNNHPPLWSSSVTDHMSWAVFSILLLATILMAIILAVHNHHKHYDQLNVLVLLQTYLIDTIPALNSAIILPVLVRLTAGPVSRTSAEICNMMMYVFVDLIIILTVASSSLKLLLVAKFGLVFSQEPQKLAGYVLGAVISAALLPNLAFTLWVLLSQGNCCSSITTAYFTDYQGIHPSISFSTVYMLLCLLVSLILLVLVVFGIPVYLKRTHTSLAIREKNMSTQFSCF